MEVRDFLCVVGPGGKSPWTGAHLTLLHPPHTQLMVLHTKETDN